MAKAILYQTNKMKTFLLPALLLIATISLAQTTTTKQGAWSDASVWNNQAFPGMSNDVVLKHDIVVDVNGFCRSLNTNGFKVTVNSGVNLTINANPGDSTLLVTLINTRYQDNLPSDSTIRIIKNAYLNGQKRILISEIELPTSTDTLYTLFVYNNIDQLITVEDYSSFAPVSFVRTISWNNNRVSKILIEDDGSNYQTENYNYTTNGANTIIEFNQLPQDTIYGSSSTYFSSQKGRLTVNNQQNPIAQTQFYNSYFHHANNNEADVSADTINTIYTNDVESNLIMMSQFKSRTEKYKSILFPDGTTDHFKDTATYIYSRSTDSNASAYSLLRKIYGTELLKLISFFAPSLSVSDVLGYFTAGDQFSHFRHELQRTDFTHVLWKNGIRDENSVVTSAYYYGAENQFDTQKRLTRSIIKLYSPNDIYSIIQYIYP